MSLIDKFNEDEKEYSAWANLFRQHGFDQTNSDEEISAGYRIDKNELEDLELIDVSPCCKKLGDCDE